jgi:flagellar motor component MotA
MPNITDTVVSEALATLEEVDIPPILKERIEQHRKNLMALAASLLAGGQDADQVRESIELVLSSFRDELLSAVDSLKEAGHVV